MNKLFALILIMFCSSISAKTLIKKHHVNTVITHNYTCTNISKNKSKSVTSKCKLMIQLKKRNPTATKKYYHDLKDLYLTEKRYDQIFLKYKNIMPDSDFRLVKAVCTVESRLNPNAKSPDGAKGLCQILPATYRSVNKIEHIVPANGIMNANHSIHAASYHLSRINRYWDGYGNKENRRKLMVASYNSGEGNILKAAKITKGKQYEDIIRQLHKVTGKRAMDTERYVALVLSVYNS